MDYGFHKDRIPRGMSWPLKRSRLDAALNEWGITCISVVNYHLGQRTDGWDGTVMWADYIAEGGRAHESMAGTIRLTFYAVSSTERKRVETLLLEEGLTRMCQWIRAAENAGEAWRSMGHTWWMTYRDGELTYKEFD